VRHRTESKYDTNGRLEETWDNIRVVVDQSGNVLCTDYANKRVTRFAYDEQGNRLKAAFADGSYTLVRYDDCHRSSRSAPTTSASSTSVRGAAWWSWPARASASRQTTTMSPRATARQVCGSATSTTFGAWASRAAVAARGPTRRSRRANRRIPT
ncbi:MAG TPA: hypothetical protein EYP56_03705, partial [Planctomycetaceae bacterium]|nr:hypothetical protein [Planctomycetaceae bacterium]